MKLLFVSLGCDKNLVDSEYMLGMLEKAGIEITDDENDADINRPRDHGFPGTDQRRVQPRGNHAGCSYQRLLRHCA